MNENKKLNKKGGNGYSAIPNRPIGGQMSYLKYTNNCQPVFQNGGKECGCDKVNSNKEDPYVFDLILNNLKKSKQQNGGGSVKNTVSKDIGQFNAIKNIAESLKDLSPKALLAIPTLILQDSIRKKKTKTAFTEQFGGNVAGFQDLIAPLGKNNLLVLGALLLLHFFAVKKSKPSESNGVLRKIREDYEIKKGGSSVMHGLTNILAPLGINAFGASVLLVLLEESFGKKTKEIQSGGNPLKSLIAPLGTNAFIATGLLIILEKMFISKIKENNTKDETKRKLIGGKLNKQYEKLFDLLGPLSFNAFAKKSFLDNLNK